MSETSGYDPLAQAPVGDRRHPDTYEGVAPETYDPLTNERRVARPVSADDMIPQPGPGPGLLKTSFRSLPTVNGPGETWARVAEAGREAFRNAPSLGTEPGNMSVISQAGQEAINNNLGWVGRNVVNPVGKLVGTGIGAVAGGGAMIGRTLNELAEKSGVVPPALQRDINFQTPLAAVLIPALKTLTPGTSMLPRPHQPVPGAVPRFAGGVADGELQTALQRLRLREGGIPGMTNPAAPTPAEITPTGIGGPMAPPAGYVPGQRVFGPGVLMSGDDVKAVANSEYARSRLLNGEGKAHITNKFVDKLSEMPAQEEGGQIFAGASSVDKLIQDAQALRDKPLSLRAIQEMDAGLNDRISDTWDPLTRSYNSEGTKLLRVQRELRDMVHGMGPDDVNGGKAGFEAWTRGRDAWAQYAKIRDVERMQEKANKMENPTTSFKVMVRNYDTRGWSEGEKAALQSAAERGRMGNLAHALGGRLGKYVGAGVGAAWGGPVGATAGMVGTEVAGAGIREMVNDAMNRRIANAIQTLTSRVPAPADAGNTIVVPRQ